MTSPNLIDPEPNLTQMIKSIENGLPISDFTKLCDSLDLPDKDLAKYIRIPKSTLAIRKKSGRFSFEESERLFRIQRLFTKALDVFEDAGLAKKWLKEDAYGLGDVSPLEYAATEIGAREVEDLLGRIEHGIFS
jgi:putative toxin-antitoxin system antitoxin component (TIGR02293 family)